MVDAWLLEKFPGRTLEELDDIDWIRLQRALHVQSIRDVEFTRAQYLDKKMDRKAISEADWTKIAEHDALLRELDLWPT